MPGSWFRFALCCAVWGALTVHTQEPPVPRVPPVAESPVAQFRALLALSTDEQGRWLAAKPEPQRRVLSAKLSEYAGLAETERELRLRATELRWYLRPLLRISGRHRDELLEGVPDEFRALVTHRLDRWDQLTPEMRASILEHESAIHYFLRWEAGTPAERAALTHNLSSTSRRELNRQFALWQRLPPAKRQLMCDRFREFFELSTSEKAKTLSALPENERLEIEETLRLFSNLAPAQRVVCINSFRKFASLPSEDRAAFLQSADRWKLMTREERDTWRRLVTHLPPLPPGFGQPPLPPSTRVPLQAAAPEPPVRP